MAHFWTWHLLLSYEREFHWTKAEERRNGERKIKVGAGDVSQIILERTIYGNSFRFKISAKNEWTVLVGPSLAGFNHFLHKKIQAKMVFHKPVANLMVKPQLQL